MQLVNVIVVGQGEEVGSLVSVWVLLVVATFTVERLVDVSNVVDQQTEGVGLGKVGLAGVKALLDVVEIGRASCRERV